MSWPRRHARGWRELRRLIEKGRAGEVAASVRRLGDEERRALAAELKEYVKAPPYRSRFELPWERRAACDVALRIAGAGCQTGADAAARWLSRRQLLGWNRDPAVDETVEAFGERDPAWLGDLATRLAGRLRTRWDLADQQLWAITARLVRVAGIEPPGSDGFVYGWVMDQRWPGQGVTGPTVDRLRADPFLDALTPRLFDVDEVGDLLAWVPPVPKGPLAAHTPPQRTTPEVLALLAAEGRLDRAMLLDRCLGRLLRGGRPARLRGFVRLHEALDPSFDEVEARVRDYVRLLPDGPPKVAGLAQGMLRRLDQEGRLPLDRLVETSDVILFRPERTLVGAQLSWINAAARRYRDQPDAVRHLLVAAATACSFDGHDIQERALTLVLRHAKRAGEAARAELLDALKALPDDLLGKARDALGGPAERPAATPATTPEATSAPTGSPTGSPALAATAPAITTPAQPPVAPRSMPPAIGSPAQLAEEISALFQGDRLDPVPLERVLEALVRLAWTDRPALRELEPVLARSGFGPGAASQIQHWFPNYFLGERSLLGALAGIATTPVAWRPPWRKAHNAGMIPKLANPRHRGRPAPIVATLVRMAEIASSLLDAPVPALVSTPSATNGQIDPAELVDRLARAEAGNWTPLAIDLELALLRLPREAGTAAIGAARALRSPAGRALAARLAAGPPADPVSRRLVRVAPDRYWRRSETERTRVLATLSPAPGSRLLARSGDDERPSLMSLLFDLPDPAGDESLGWWQTSMTLACWPSLLPSHREVIAAHALRSMWNQRRGGEGAGVVLPLLAEADGPVGPAVIAILAQGLGARELADRASTTDALVTLARRGQLDGAALGLELADTVRGGLVALSRAVPVLRDLVASGAGPGALALVAAALPQLVPPAVARPPHGIADLVAVGAEAAAGGERPGAAIPHGLPALDELVRRGGSSRLAAESRRLHALLSRS